MWGKMTRPEGTKSAPPWEPTTKDIVSDAFDVPQANRLAVRLLVPVSGSSVVHRYISDAPVEPL
ncbi:hypothetical protein Q5752_000356 [Cryptotrichosporon argae]